MTRKEIAQAIRDRRAENHPKAPRGFIPIAGHEGRYAISKDGQIFSHYFGRLLVLVPDNGYQVVSLGYGDRSFVHVLVAATFIGKPPKGTEIDHENRVRSDNRVENLRYIPHRHNQHNAAKHGRNGNPPASRFKGVTRQRNRWRAAISSKGRLRYIGAFDDERDAAMAYDREARKIYGARATTNKKLGYL